MAQHKSIHWFRKGLRLHDNPAFHKACEQASDVYPIFILDPWFAKSGNCRVGINRWRFLIQSLQDLDSSLKRLNLRLFVVRGEPHQQLEILCKKWKISRVTFEVDTEPYAVKRDEAVERRMTELGIEVIKCVSHTVFDTAKVVKANGDSAPLTYQRFQTVVSKLAAPDQPLNTPTLADVKNCKASASDRHEEEFGVPTLAELGRDEKSCGPLLYPGGETEALVRMERHLKKTNWICSFEKPKTSPNSLEPSTTVLSPYLKFGCLSPRLFYHQLANVYKGHGQTGFPFIDAIMRQLRQEGWVHHLARHAVACFLTRGDLWISWEEGMKVFEELLLDADWSLNAGNWMWLSASAFFHQYFRVYSPIAFGKKTDPNGDYIRKYVPEVKKFPAKFIFEPWTAPLSTQQAAGCVIGKDYPRPLVDHSVISKTNIGKMAAAYNAAKKDNPSKASGSEKKADKGKKRPSKGLDGFVQKKLKT